MRRDLKFKHVYLKQIVGIEVLLNHPSQEGEGKAVICHCATLADSIRIYLIKQITVGISCSGSNLKIEMLYYIQLSNECVQKKFWKFILEGYF